MREFGFTGKKIEQNKENCLLFVLLRKGNEEAKVFVFTIDTYGLEVAAEEINWAENKKP